jgi:hypothetical protein
MLLYGHEKITPAAATFSESIYIKSYWLAKRVRGYIYNLNNSWDAP